MKTLRGAGDRQEVGKLDLDGQVLEMSCQLSDAVKEGLVQFFFGSRWRCGHGKAHISAPYEVLVFFYLSKHAGSDLHPVRIGWGALARSGSDVSCTPACFRTGSVWPKRDTISQN